MLKLILRKLGMAVKENALILVMQVIQDFVGDVRRNGLDDRKRTRLDDEKSPDEIINQRLKNKL